MAFGLPDTGGEFLPLFAYNAKSGRFSLVEKVEGRGGDMVKEEQELETKDVVFVADLATCKKGWLLFRKGAAPVKVVNGIDEPMPPEVEGDFGTDDKGKPIRPRGGFVCHVVLADKKLREFASNAAACVTGFGEVMDAYEARSPDDANKLPMVRLVRTSKVGKNQNYQPAFEIVKWVDRNPDDFGAGPAATYKPPRQAAAAAKPSSAERMGGGANALNDQIPF